MFKRLLFIVLVAAFVPAAALSGPKVPLEDLDLHDPPAKTSAPLPSKTPVKPVPANDIMDVKKNDYKSLVEPVPARFNGSKAPILAKVAPYNDKDYSWSHTQDKNNHSIYVSDTPWSRYRTFKAETVIDQPLEVLMEVLLDVDGFAAWLPDCLQSRHLKTLGADKFEGHFLVHVIWDSIWPITNRDFVIEVVTSLDWKTEELTVELISVDDSDVPVAKGTKRLKKFYSRYHFSIVDRNRTRVTYSMVVDPDLPFPSRIAEIQTAPIPYKTLVGLAKRAQEPVFRQRAVRELF